MFWKKVWRVVLICLCLFGLFDWTQTHLAMEEAERQTCLGLNIQKFDRTSEEDNEYKYKYRDFSNDLMFCGEPAAIDTERNTIYISQNIDRNTGFHDLQGKLTLRTLNKHYDMFFYEDDFFEDLYKAVQKGHGFDLILLDNDRNYMSYQVIFTTLPVMKLDGIQTRIKTEKVHDQGFDTFRERGIQTGNMCLWAAHTRKGNDYAVESSKLEWHVRGGLATLQNKKSWKLSLKKDGDLNNNLNLLGMGKDDDWILNPMSMDDTKMREKLFAKLWNELCRESPDDMPMSEGEYVEVVINGGYYGIYMLQRRVDPKFLGMGEDDILLKGHQSWYPETVVDGFEIVRTPLSKCATYYILDPMFYEQDYSILNRKNLIDVDLFLQFSRAIDNQGYKNMFYLLKKQDDGYEMTLVPWDTDMSFGIIWHTIMLYDFKSCVETRAQRMEMEYLQENTPEIRQETIARWDELKHGILSAEHVENTLASLEQQVVDSGAFRRDREQWEPAYGETADTIEKLHTWIGTRLYWLDYYYDQFRE